jgi:hypothetical protein
LQLAETRLCFIGWLLNRRSPPDRAAKAQLIRISALEPKHSSVIHSRVTFMFVCALLAGSYILDEHGVIP